MLRDRKILKGCISFISLSIFILFTYSTKNSPEMSSVESNELVQEVSELDKQITYFSEFIEAQDRVDNEIIQELSSKSYTIEAPLIIINPYDRSPLTAYIAFYSESVTKASIWIEGKTEDTSFSYEFEELKKQHIIPVLGLYSDTNNKVLITLKNSENQILSENTFFLQTDELSPDLKSNIFNVYKTEDQRLNEVNFSYDNGLNNAYKTAFDSNGDYRWYLDKSKFNTFYLASYESNGFVYLPISDLLIKTDYFGKIINIYYLPYTAHHDLEIYENNIVIASRNNLPNTFDDYIYSMDLDTGKVLNTIDYKEVLLRTRQNDLYYNNSDWMHMNSIFMHEEDLIVSSNWQGTILKNDWLGNIKWMLSDPKDYPTKFQDYLLKPIGENFEYPYNQHAVEVIEYDNNLDTLEIIVFDNGSSRFSNDEELQRKIANFEIVEPELYSRLVIYQIDEENMTVEQLFEYGSQRPELFSKFRGDADLLQNNRILGTFNQEYESGSASTVYVEIDSNGKVIWEVWATSSNQQNFYQDYRLERKEIYNFETLEVNLEEEITVFIDQDIINYNNEIVQKD